MPAFFTKDTLKFLAELEKNNNKGWFTKNKPRYEEHVKEPCARFAAAVASRLQMDPHVMRIYRDIRFSKDKTPYKSHIGIGFGQSGAGSAPSIFLHIEAKESAVYGGMWQPEPTQVDAIRAAILAHQGGWERAKKVGLSEDENALKRAPRGIDPAHPLVEDLKRKNFTAGVPLSPSDVTASDFDKRFLAATKKLAPLNDFLQSALK